MAHRSNLEFDTSSLEKTGAFLDWIRSGLTEDERDQFGLELLDAARRKDDVHFQYVIESWAMTVKMRSHPEFQRQNKEILNLQESGELFKGIDRKAASG